MIECLNMITQRKLCLLGIVPRHPISLVFGPICSHFIHSGFNHLFFNMIPLFVLSVFMMEQSLTYMICISLMMMYMQSILLWCLGRPGIHVGASGLIMSYIGYLIYHAYAHPNLSSVLLAILCVYYFGSALFSILPSEEKTSWEGHLYGLISGVSIAYYGQCVYPFTKITTWLLQG